jgi:hypothetical protein
MKYYYVKNDDLIITDLNEDYDRVLKEEGYVRKEIIEDADVNPDIVIYQDFDSNFNFIKDKYLARTNKSKNIEKINYLKQQLLLEDYKVIKCYEAQLIGASMPYDITELVNKRNLIRAQINELEAIIYVID